MAYDEKYREKAVAYKKSGHTFAELKEVFGIYSTTYYEWASNYQTYGCYAPLFPRKEYSGGKIRLDELKHLVETYPDAYLKEYEKHFNCSVVSIFNRLKQLKITLKKDFYLHRSF